MVAKLLRSAHGDPKTMERTLKVIAEAFAPGEACLEPAKKHVDFIALREEAIIRFSKTLSYLAK
jgi:hypothetical protein